MAATATSRAPTDLGASSLPRDLSEDGGAGSLDNATGGAPAAAAASDPVAPLRVKTLQIRWHAEAANGKNAPILSIDMHPTLPVLATAGADSEVKLWRVFEDPDPAKSWSTEFLVSLAGHDGTVNCVRFSPNGECLASAGDDRTIIIWRMQDGCKWNEARNADHDFLRSLLRGHVADVYDLSWSPDSQGLMSGSVDNMVLIWNVAKGRALRPVKDHAHFVKGVAWDPEEEFLASQSSDRTVRVYTAPEMLTKARRRLMKAAAKDVRAGREPEKLPVPVVGRRDVRICTTIKVREYPEEMSAAAATPVADGATGAAPDTPGAVGGAGGAAGPSSRSGHRMFLDETVPSFFRRLAWSPDGRLLLTPTAQFQPSPGSSRVNTVFAFARGSWDEPVAHYPCGEKASIGVRFCPKLYECQPGVENTALDLPYRMLFAVTTLNAILVYDTNQAAPVAVISNIHFDQLTDVAWTADGDKLVVCSIDGYVSIVAFSPGVLGKQLEGSKLPAVLRREHPHTFPKAPAPAPVEVVAAPAAVAVAAAKAAAEQQGKSAATLAASPVAATPPVVAPAVAVKRKAEEASSGDEAAAGSGHGGAASSGGAAATGTDTAPAATAAPTGFASTPAAAAAAAAQGAAAPKRRRIAPTLVTVAPSAAGSLRNA